MSRACRRARHAWLLSQDGKVGPISRLMMNLHMKACKECLEFAAAATETITVLSQAPFDSPPKNVALFLHEKAAAESVRAREADQFETVRIRARQALLGSFAGAAIALIIALPRVIEMPSASDRIASPASLEDNLDYLEDRLNCLQALIDDFNWDSLEGGDPCTDV